MLSNLIQSFIKQQGLTGLQKMFIGALILVMLIWHLFSLNISPLPWFDEVLFASITKSFVEGRGLVMDVAPFHSDQPTYTYGPVYFILTALSTEFLGFGIFSFRLVNLVFGIGSIFVFYLLLKEQNLPVWIILLVFLSLWLDTRFLQTLHNARMDFVALFFSLSAIYCFLHKPSGHWQTIIVAILMSLAMLTTPRFFFIIIPLGLFIVFRLITNREWSKFLVFIIVPAVLGLLWIHYSHGSLTATIDYYLGSSDANSASIAGRFLGGRIYIPVYQVPLIITAFVLTALSFRELMNNKLAFLSLLFIVLFYTLVHESGGYNAIIVAFYYILIALGSKYAKKPKLALTLIILVLFVNASIFLLKTSTIILYYNERSPLGIEHFVSNNVPPRATVVGDRRYYYAFVKNDCPFQFIDRRGQLDERVEYHKEFFNAQYIMLSSETDKNIKDAYRGAFEIYDEIPYSINSSDNLIKRIITRLNPIEILGTYEGVLLVVKME